jgi:hypothetical protein
LKYRTPGYELPPHIDLNIINEGGNFIFRSNLDLKNAAKFYTRRHESSFGMATLLTDIMAIRENLFFCARFPSELATDPVYGRIVQNRISEILRRTTASAEDRSVFHRLVFDGGRSVREAINSGRRNFKDLLVMLEKAEKFKKWLHTLEADEDLVREYFKEATSSTWIEKLPGKTMRWAVFTGLGVGIDALGAGGAGTAFGIGLGALDQFVLDKMLRGWKPNQFIDNTLQEFVS